MKNNHEIILKQYAAYCKEQPLYLGTAGSYGMEMLTIIREGVWAEYDILAAFHPPVGAAVQVRVGANNQIDVPIEATAEKGMGEIVFAGYKEGVRQIAVDVLYTVAPSSGASGTEPAEPTPDVVQQILSAASNAEETAKSVRDDAEKIKERLDEIPKIDDTAITTTSPWSSKQIVDTLCPPIEETGNPVVCYPVAGYPLGVKAKWEPVQEGSGTPYPAGGGKNLFNPAWMPEKAMDHGVMWTIAPDGTVTANGTAVGTAYYNSNYFSLPAGTYTISAMSHFRISIIDSDAGNATIAVQAVGKPCTFTVENDIQKATLFFAASGTLDNVSAKPQIEKGATATAYAPYANIRPIKGRDSVTITRQEDNQVITLTLPETVYGGEVDAVTGDGKRTWGIIDNYAGETIPREWISDRDVYSADKNPTVGAQVAYRLAEPVPFTATGAQPIPALSGTNTLLTDADSVSVSGRADLIRIVRKMQEK